MTFIFVAERVYIIWFHCRRNHVSNATFSSIRLLFRFVTSDHTHRKPESVTQSLTIVFKGFSIIFQYAVGFSTGSPTEILIPSHL